MDGYGVGEVGTGAGELLDRIVNGTLLIAGLGASGMTGLGGRRLVSTMSW